MGQLKRILASLVKRDLGTESLPMLRSFVDDIEGTLRKIDFDEVTAADKATFVARAVETQVRAALAHGRFDLAVQLRHFGERRIAELLSAE
jgi:hypothetical protein